MSAPLELRSLPFAERLQLIEDLWDSIAEDQHALPDHSSVAAKLRERKERYLKNPSSGVPWETAKGRIRSDLVI
jgi:putative addiction module component (TIGR02574 family)